MTARRFAAAACLQGVGMGQEIDVPLEVTWNGVGRNPAGCRS
jgi:hypothetical protein